ncbi:MAG: YggS family pyridoxal phosphate-dependent enzyme [Bacillota bacterium]
MDYIRSNIDRIKENINNACGRVGRNPAEVEIIGVTKTIDIDRINYALECGITNIGENKVQELTDKYEKIQKNVKWHLIGHLQTNKVKYIIDKVDLIHSLDSIGLAEEIEKRAAKAGLLKEVMVQINVAQEESKFGISLEEADSFLEKLLRFNNLKVVGLMTIAPFLDNVEEVRPFFRLLKEKYVEYSRITGKNIEMKYLSMGMTNDYEVAIEEGANLVRIGTGIFGARNYNV